MGGEQLRVIEGNARGKSLELEAELLIGREASQQEGGWGDDPELSRRHARVARDTGGQLTIEDLGSTNGTFVNGVRLRERQALKVGDSIHVGRTTLQLTDSRGAGPLPVTDEAPTRPLPEGTALRPAHASTPRRPAPKRSAGRSFLRFVSSVMLVSGVLLLADAVTTLTWQEPVSYLTSLIRQSSLESALGNAAGRVQDRKPLKGDAIGRIELPTLGRKNFVVEGTDTANLRKGPGHYPDTPLPGESGTVGIAGHRTTHGAPFRTIDKLRPGDPVLLDVPYGRFVYRVERTRIVPPTETSVKRPVGYDQVILSACHPLYSAAQRIVVFARFVRREPARVTG